MQADSGVEEVSAPELSVEEVWSGAEGPPSIADLALEQKGIYYPVVQHHWLLTSLLHAAMAFKVKAKPLSLFDSKVGRRPHFKLRAENLRLPRWLIPDKRRHTVRVFPLQGKNALFRDLSIIQLMPSGVMDSGLILSRQEVNPAPLHLRVNGAASDPPVCVSVPLPGPDRLGAGPGWFSLSL